MSLILVIGILCFCFPLIIRLPRGLSILLTSKKKTKQLFLLLIFYITKGPMHKIHAQGWSQTWSVIRAIFLAANSWALPPTATQHWFPVHHQAIGSCCLGWGPRGQPACWLWPYSGSPSVCGATGRVGALAWHCPHPPLLTPGSPFTIRQLDPEGRGKGLRGQPFLPACLPCPH